MGFVNPFYVDITSPNEVRDKRAKWIYSLYTHRHVGHPSNSFEIVVRHRAARAGGVRAGACRANRSISRVCLALH